MRKIHEYANRMRQNPTAAERRFLERASHLDVYSQVIYGRYIADFLFPQKGLFVEVDGGYHNDPMQILKDTERDSFMRYKGFRVLRILNEDVETFDLGKITRLPDIDAKIYATLMRSVGFTHNPPATPREKGTNPRAKGTNARAKRPTVQNPAGTGKKNRIYAVYIPSGGSCVVQGKPRVAMRLVNGKSRAFYKRFQSVEEAQTWLNGRLAIVGKSPLSVKAD